MAPELPMVQLSPPMLLSATPLVTEIVPVTETGLLLVLVSVMLLV
jgi:hypothetical protein